MFKKKSKYIKCLLSWHSKPFISIVPSETMENDFVLHNKIRREKSNAFGKTSFNVLRSETRFLPSRLPLRQLLVQRVLLPTPVVLSPLILCLLNLLSTHESDNVIVLSCYNSCITIRFVFWTVIARNFIFRYILTISRSSLSIKVKWVKVKWIICHIYHLYIGLIIISLGSLSMCVCMSVKVKTFEPL